MRHHRTPGLRSAAIGLLTVGAVLLGALPASAAGPTPVVKTNLEEQGPAGGGGFVFWSQNSASDKTHYTLFGKKSGSPRFQVNAAGTQGYAGGIDGTTFVYQQLNRAGTVSDLFLYDLDSKARTKLPAKVNSKAIEYSPSMSGDRILFSREIASTHTRKALLFHRTTSKLVELDSVTGANTYIATGQINGSFAVWEKCKPTCNVFERNLSTGTTTKIANPDGKYQYGEAVTSNGTVYFARSGQGCGTHIAIVRDPPHGPQVVVVNLAAGIDLARMNVVVGSNPVQVLFDRYVCATKQFDIYRFTG